MKIVLAAALLLLPLTVRAETVEKEVSQETLDISVAIHSISVRCSSLGYGVPELKVDVLDLDWAASFNHRQQGEGKPCMTAGVCGGALTPDRVLAGGEGDVATVLHVLHKEVGTIDARHGTCSRELVEELSMVLRGLTFSHRRSTPLSTTTATECRRLYK